MSLLLRRPPGREAYPGESVDIPTSIDATMLISYLVSSTYIPDYLNVPPSLTKTTAVAL